jgi:hypothetical protein
MKKLLVPLAVIALLAFAVPSAFAEWELGMGWSPYSSSQSASYDPSALSKIINFHVGYSWSVLYASWDAYAMPDYWVYSATNSGGNGYYAPGFLNLWDVGLKFVLRPIIGYIEVGPNSLYIYGGNFGGGFGVNARAGIGFKFGWWGINLSYTQVFATWNDLGYAFDQAFHGNGNPLLAGGVPSLNVAIYF